MAEPVAVAVAASSFQAILQRLFDLVAAFRTAVKDVETAPGKTKELADLVDRAATILKSLEKVEGYEELLTAHVTALGEQLLLALEEVQNDEQRKKNGQVVAVAKALFHHGASKQNKGSMAIIQVRIRELMVDVSQAVCVIALLRTLPPVHHQAIARDEIARRRDSFPEYIHSWGEVRNEVGGMVLPDGADSANSSEWKGEVDTVGGGGGGLPPL